MIRESTKHPLKCVCSERFVRRASFVSLAGQHIFCWKNRDNLKANIYYESSTIIYLFIVIQPFYLKYNGLVTLLHVTFTRLTIQNTLRFPVT